MSLRRDLRVMSRGWRWGRTPLVPADAARFQPDPESREFPTAWSRSPAAVGARTVLQRYGLRPLIWSQVTPTVTGREALDRLDGPVVFVANHGSHLDAPLVLSTLPDRWRRSLAIAAAADYFFDTWWRAIGSAMVFSTFPLERKAGTGAATAGTLLDEGWSVLMFPEGTRSADGWGSDYRRGAAHLALGCGVPVVPIAIRGSFTAMPRGRAWPRPGRLPVRLRYGAPIVPRPGEDAAALAGRIQATIAQLLDEDATSWYGSLRRAVDGATPSPAGPAAARWRRVWTATEPVTVEHPVRRRRSPWPR